MNGKQDHISKMLEMQKMLQKSTAKPVVEKESEVIIENTTEEVKSTLPTTYLSANQLKLSTKEIAKNTNYLDKMQQVDSRYDDLKISEEKAIRIRKELVRLTTGVSAVAPLICKGNECAFAKSCITGDADILSNKTKKLRDIEIGDTVYSFNTTKKRIEKDCVTHKEVILNKEVYLIKTWYGNSIKATIDHPFLTSTSSDRLVWKSIEDGLKEGSTILITDLDDIDDSLESIGDAFVDKILSIKYYGIQDVYDITIKKNQNFIANNIISHNCQPPGDVVLVAGFGYKPIESLVPGVDKIVTYGASGYIHARGRDFTLHERDYNGVMYNIKTNTKSYACTSDHITSVVWNENAIGKHIVYLMRKDDKFRVGVTTLIQDFGKGRRQSGLNVRCRMEKADQAWILSVHDNRTSALLDEEFYSIKASAPKSLFISDDASRHSRWNGKNVWVTQEELDSQFRRTNKDLNFYKEFLTDLGLDFNYPFYVKGSTEVNSFKSQMKVRACNVIPKMMSVLNITGYSSDYVGKLKDNLYTELEEIYIEKQRYVGKVYSLDVDKEHNYFTGYGLLTNNCPFIRDNVAPIGLGCQPPTSKVLTAEHGYVFIKDLDENIHKLVHIVARDGIKQTGGTGKIRSGGSSFKKGSRPFKGNLIRVITESGKFYDSTPDHISYIKWNKEAIKNKVAVYLMYKEGNFRVGRTKLLQGGNTDKSHVYGGFSHRCYSEGAEKGWILGVYDNVVEAHMAEEYWSIITQTPKIMFLATKEKQRYDGFSRWVTDSQLKNHFNKFDMSLIKYKKILSDLGLDFDYPIYSKDGDPIDNGVSFSRMIRIRSCNILPKLMDVYVLKTIKDDKAYSTRSTKDQWDYDNISSIEYIPYDGLVYSLGVEQNPNYITDFGIATHNCLIEQQLLEYWMARYKEEFKVEDDQITDLHAIGRLCTYDIYDMRLTRYLSEHDQTLLVDFVSSYDEHGNAISNKAVSAAWDAIDRIDRMRSKTLKELMATREAKAKIIQTVAQTHNTNSINVLKDKFEELIRKQSSMKTVIDDGT